MSMELEGQFCVPRSFEFDHLVEDGEELSHGGGDDDFERFAGGFESGGKGFEAVVVKQGVEGGHVEGVAGVGAAALDGTFAVTWAGLVAQGRDACEFGDLGAADRAEFGELDEELVGGVGSDARDRVDDPCGFAPVVVVVDEFGDGAVEVFDLLFEQTEEFLGLDAGEFGRVTFEAVFFGDAHLHQRASAGDQVLELLKMLGNFL